MRLKTHFQKLYRGELPLWNVFWVQLIATPIVVFSCSFAIVFEAYQLNRGSQPFPYSLILLIFLVPMYLFILYLPFITFMISRTRCALWLKIPAAIVGVMISGIYICYTLVPQNVCACGDDEPATNLAKVKESASMLSGAFSAYDLKYKISKAVGASDLEQFLNYVKQDRKRKIDSVTGERIIDCANLKLKCLLLHNGSVMAYNAKETLGGIDDKHAIRVIVDPDGDINIAGNVKAVALYQYADGSVRIDSNLKPGTESSLSKYEADIRKVPKWLEWD